MSYPDGWWIPCCTREIVPWKIRGYHCTLLLNIILKGSACPNFSLRADLLAFYILSFHSQHLKFEGKYFLKKITSKWTILGRSRSNRWYEIQRARSLLDSCLSGRCVRGSALGLVFWRNKHMERSCYCMFPQTMSFNFHDSKQQYLLLPEPEQPPWRCHSRLPLYHWRPRQVFQEYNFTKHHIRHRNQQRSGTTRSSYQPHDN